MLIRECLPNKSTFFLALSVSLILQVLFRIFCGTDVIEMDKGNVDCSHIDYNLNLQNISNNITIETHHDSSRNTPRPGKGPVARLDEQHTNKVIIYAKYRTGSTFTSEFFFKHHDIAYIFEPLHVNKSPKTVKDGQQIIWDMLSCNFETAEVQRITKWWLDKIVFCQIPQQTPGCVHGQDFPINRAKRHCLSVQTRVVKIIRIENLWELEKFMRAGVKVIQVIRDPRGLASSRGKIHRRTEYFGQLPVRSFEYCMGALEDIQYIRRQAAFDEATVRKLYHVVRYEDLAQHPEFQLEKLYDFLGIRPDDSLKTWVKSVASASQSAPNKTGGYAYNTKRANPAYTSIAWHRTMDFADVLEVQKNCVKFMDLFGYLPFDKEDDLRNAGANVVKPFDINIVFHDKS